MNLGNLRSGGSYARRGEGTRRFLVVIVLLVAAAAAVALAYLFLSPTVAQDNNVLIVEMTAYQWGYNVTSAPAAVEFERRPHGDVLRIPLGATVRFKVFAQANNEQEWQRHGFVITGMGVVETLDVGTARETEVLFDREGTFVYFCSTFCGSGHNDMEGVIIVEGAG